MNVLEKILEEILQYRKDNSVLAGKQVMAIEEIIRSHMNNHSGDFNEMVSNWIPVEDTDHTPENESYVLVSFSNSNVPDIARYEENEEGGTYYPGDDEKSYLKYGLFVNAWQPLLKSYRPDPCKGCFGAANNDCGKCEYGGGSSE
ncbi:putative uncharacterized protein [Firmicutes bacterium CAG:646]|nr:putative uncharacterized protein [Firmicutes bacterium CAG:646]